MAVEITHKFVSEIPDTADESLVGSSNWNDTHKILLEGASLIGYPTAGGGEASEISLGDGLEFSGPSLRIPSGWALRPENIGSLAEHQSPNGADKVALLSRLYAAGWIGGVRILQIVNGSDTTTYNTTTTNSYAANGGTPGSITPSSPTSKLLLMIHSYSESYASSGSNSRIAARLHYYDGNEYQIIPSSLSLQAGINSSGPSSVRWRGVLSDAVILLPGHIRSDSGVWLPRWKFNVASGDSEVSIFNTSYILVEYEDGL